MICPKCGKTFDVDDEMADKICCPECGGIAKSKDKKVNDGQSYENEESIFEAIKKE